MKGMPASRRLKTFDLSHIYTPFAEDSSSILWQRGSDHDNQRILRVDSSQATVQDQYTSEIGSVGEKSNVSIIRVHDLGELGLKVREREHIYCIGLGHFHDLITIEGPVGTPLKIEIRGEKKVKKNILKQDAQLAECVCAVLT